MSYEHSPKFLGDSSFNYRVEKNLTIKGFIDNFLNTNGVEKTVSGVNSFIASAADFQPIIINGVDFGSGRVDNISFSDGNWVRKADYSAKIVIFETGDLSNMLGEYYNGVRESLTNPSNGPELIESIDESFSFSVSDSKEYSFDHSVNLKLIQGSYNSFNCARSIASGFLKNLVPFGFINNQYSGFYARPSKRYYTESYDLINGKYSFAEKFSTHGNNNTYGFVRSHNLSIDRDGLTSVVENGKIQGIVDPVYNAALSGLSVESSGSYGRCADFYTLNNAVDAASYQLINKILEKSIDTDKFAGTIDYSHKYNNDELRLNSYYVDKGTTKELNSDFVTFTTSVFGKIVGDGKLGDASKMNNALVGFSVHGGGTYGGVMIGDKVSYSDYRGEISFSRSYTTSPEYISAGDVLKYEITKSVSPRKEDYNDITMCSSTESVKYSQRSLQKTSISEKTTYRNSNFNVGTNSGFMTLNQIIDSESYSFSYPDNSVSHQLSYME